MRIVGVIPARWGSVRFPGKILVELCGKPLIMWVVEAVNRAQRLDRVLVATDDDRIREAVESVGGEVAMTRSDHPSGTDRIAEAIAGQGVDIAINIQGDEPLIDPALIDALAGALESDSTCDMATAAVPMEDPELIADPSVVKVVCDEEGRALYFSRSVIPFERDADVSAAGLYRRHVGIYAYRAAFLERLVATPPCKLECAEKLEQLRALHMGASIRVLETEGECMGVDTPEDVERVESVLKTRAKLG